MNSQAILTHTSPRTSLLDKDLTTMTEEELRLFVQEVREKRNSQQIAAENKPARRKATTKSQSAINKAKLMEALMADDDEEDDET